MVSCSVESVLCSAKIYRSLNARFGLWRDTIASASSWAAASSAAVSCSFHILVRSVKESASLNSPFLLTAKNLDEFPVFGSVLTIIVAVYAATGLLARSMCCRLFTQNTIPTIIYILKVVLELAVILVLKNLRNRSTADNFYNSAAYHWRDAYYAELITEFFLRSFCHESIGD
jgi:hypothetical protein